LFMTSDRRERIRKATKEEIKVSAWQQIAEQGAAALSLREIARRMGMTAPALYNYFHDRDALVTALVIDAFTSFGEALTAARQTRPADDHPGRLWAIGLAYRQWAVGHPQRYNLIFGTPIPGYHIGSEAQPAASQSFMVLVEVLGEAQRAGALKLITQAATLPPGLQAYLAGMCQAFQIPYPPAVITLAVATWAKIHGLVSLELYGMLHGFLGDDNISDFFEYEFRWYMRQLGLTP
jgi:AcrR family transcriptional regulator